MDYNRRNFLKTTGAGLMGASVLMAMHNKLFAAGLSPAGIGMCDWNLDGSATPDIIPKAKKVGLSGIQVSVGTNPANIPLRDPKIRQQYLELGKKHGIQFHSVAAGGILNDIPLATEPQSAVYVIDALEAAKALGAKNILIAFFGNGDLRLQNSAGEFIKHTENGFSWYDLDTKKVNRVIEALKQIAPRAEDMGIALGLENTLTAKQNLEIIAGINSPAASVYYDVGNSWGNGYNVPAEIKLLDNRICEVHLKDWNTPMLGSADAMVDMPKCAQALAEINYNKWIVLETSGRKDMFVPDTQTNVAYSKKVFNIA